MPHPLAAYPPLSAAGRGEARRFLPEEGELLPPWHIPEGLSLDPSPLSILPLFPYSGKSRRWARLSSVELGDRGSVLQDGRTDGRTHTHNNACALMLHARKHLNTQAGATRAHEVHTLQRTYFMTDVAEVTTRHAWIWWGIAGGGCSWPYAPRKNVTSVRYPW
jgi:hypothetical protein